MRNVTFPRVIYILPARPARSGQAAFRLGPGARITCRAVRWNKTAARKAMLRNIISVQTPRVRMRAAADAVYTTSASRAHAYFKRTVSPDKKTKPTYSNPNSIIVFEIESRVSAYQSFETVRSRHSDKRLIKFRFPLFRAEFILFFLFVNTASRCETLNLKRIICKLA